MGLAIFLVIMFHSVNLGFPIPWLNRLWSYGYLGVDVFILLSGMGLSLSLSRRKQSLREFYIRRLVRILPAYWLVAGCCGLFLRSIGKTGFRGMFWTLSTLSLWMRHPDLNYFDWYIPALLALYMVTPICYTLLKSPKWRLPILIIGYIFSILVANALPYTVDLSSLIYRIPVFLIGISVGLFIAEGRALTVSKICLYATGLIAAPILSNILAGRGVPLLIFYQFALYAIFVCLAVACLLQCMPKKGFRRLLNLMGESSLEIYLFNVVVVQICDYLSLLLPFNQSEIGFYIIIIPANILLGIGLHRLLQPVTKWLTFQLT